MRSVHTLCFIAYATTLYEGTRYARYVLGGEGGVKDATVDRCFMFAA